MGSGLVAWDPVILSGGWSGVGSVTYGHTAGVCVLRWYGEAHRFILGLLRVGRFGDGLLKRCWSGRVTWIHGMVFCLDCAWWILLDLEWRRFSRGRGNCCVSW